MASDVTSLSPIDILFIYPIILFISLFFYGLLNVKSLTFS
ncbi:Hypothetical protein ETEE_2789 [Edwardsiella anguillarum ET080813]|uniref:Uncharacterized protein n=1 Tax=Edwardsiella anguillarum ET080813 TaxID=667120 RepID=A0A076LRB1_9GAMM|nr:Hypothetical protein ETEE_2789 [Edwardsiella anguillarum ET080813]